MARSHFFMVMLGMVIGIGSAVAQDCLDYSEYLRWLGGVHFAGEASDVVIKADHALVAGAYDGLGVFDVTDPAHPLLVGAVATPGLEVGVAVSGNVAYLAARSAGVHVVSLVDLEHPELRTTLDTDSSVYAVVTLGLHLLVADLLDGLQILDVSVPDSPVIVGHVAAGHRVVDVAEAAGHAYLADCDAGVQIVDVTVPGAPVSLGFVGGLGTVTTVHVAGSLLVVGSVQGQLRLLDITDPGAPVLLGVTGTLDEVLAITSHGDQVLVGIDGALMVYDVGDPQVWRHLATHDFEDEVTGITWDDGRAIFTTHDRSYYNGGTLQAVDLTYPAMPPEVGENSDLTFGGGVTDMVHAGDLVHVTRDLHGLEIFDVSDPTDPRPVGSYQVQEFAKGVAAAGNLVFLPDLYYGLYVIDVADPAQPVLVGESTEATGLRKLALGDGWLAAADQQQRFVIFDLSDPSVPTIMATVPVPAVGLAVTGDLLLATTLNDQLIVYDVTVPAAPIELDRLTLGEYLLDVTVADNLALVAARADGFHIVDISDPTALELLATAWTPSPVARVVAIDDVAYAACAGTGIMVFDLTNPAVPLPVASVGEWASNTTQSMALGPAFVYWASLYSHVRFSVAYLACNATGVPGGGGGEAAPRAPSLTAAPNPFNPATEITFALPAAGRTRLTVYDLAGREVAVLLEGWLPAGPHVVPWRPVELLSGTYFYQLRTDRGDVVGKGTLLK